MRLGKDQKGKTWVKKTKFSKCVACIFVYHELLLKRRVSKSYLEKVLEVDSRITLYNYISDIKSFIINFDCYLDYIIDLYYDSSTKEYVLDLRKKK